MADPVKPTIEIDEPDLMTEHQNDGNALRPSDTRDKGRPQKGPGRRSWAKIIADVKARHA